MQSPQPPVMYHEASAIILVKKGVASRCAGLKPAARHYGLLVYNADAVPQARNLAAKDRGGTSDPVSRPLPTYCITS